MAKFLDKSGLKRALAGFWVGAKAYIDEVSRVAAAAATELQNKINLKQDILGFWGTYDKTNNKVATESEVKSHVSGITGALSSLLTTAKGSLVAAINEVKGLADAAKTAADNAKSDSAVTVSAAATAAEGYLKTYNVYQGGSDEAHKVGTIDIPKDLVVTAGEVVTDPAGMAKGKYIKLTIANQTEPLYINVKDLVDVYTAQASAAQVQVAISDKNVVSASIVAKSIGSTELSDAVNASLALADSALQEHQSLAEYRKASAQDAIDATKVDKVEGMGLSHNDLTDTLKAGYDDAVSKKHTHANKAELDKIADGDKAKWDAYATSKVDVEAGKSLLADTEIARLAGMATGATADEALSNDEIDAVIAEIFPAA